MDRRKNFADTLSHRKPQQIILDFGGNPLSSMEGASEKNLLEYLGYSTALYDDSPLLFGKVRRIDERILEHYNVDTRSIGGILNPVNSQFKFIQDGLYKDEWGITRKLMGDYWEIVDYPLKNSTLEDLKSYQFPNAQSIDMDKIAEWKNRAEYLYEKTEYIICAEHPVYGVFELLCWLCGFEDALIKMALEPEYIHYLFSKILEYQKEVIEIYYKELGPYIHYTSSGDDFATQNAPFMSPDMFNEFIAPYLKERIRYTKTFTNAKYLHHSCGSVFTLIDALIDCGVDILNPIQPKAKGMSCENLKNNFGEKIVFHGGIDTQELLPFCTAEVIDSEVKRIISVMGENGGYIVAAAHNIQHDVSPEKLDAMLNAVNKYREI
ncbi:MAG: uroporphyrinogen decarboxylase family protein [Christensenella sp.]